MPNGFHGPTEEWQRMEGPLRTIDDLLDAFAERHGMTVTRNDHNWPERSLRWGEAPHRSIHISLADEQNLLFGVGICAWEDRSKGRFWKTRTLIESRSLEELRPQLNELLEKAKNEVERWRSRDLVAAP